MAVSIEVRPVMLSDVETARALNMSRERFLNFVGQGEMGPAPVYLYGDRYWLVSELRRWIEAGCPDHRTWYQIEGGRVPKGSAEFSE